MALFLRLEPDYGMSPVPEFQASLDAIAFGPGLLGWLVFGWPLVIAGALLALSSRPVLRRYARWTTAVGAGGTLALGVLATTSVTTGSSVWWPGWTAVRIGSWDASFDVWLDPRGAGMVLALATLGSGGLFASAASLGPAPSRAAVRVVARTALLTGVAIFAVGVGNLVGLALGWFATGSVVRALGRDADGRDDAPSGALAGRAGDAALLIGVAFTFWGAGGRWLADGYRTDFRARFAAVTEPAARANGRLPAHDLRIAQRGPGEASPTAIPAVPRPPVMEIDPPRSPTRPPPSRGDARSTPSSLAAAGRSNLAFLSMTTHPGAEVYFGLSTQEDLRANRGTLARCEDQPAWARDRGPQVTASCVTTSPFLDRRITSGMHQVVIVPGAGAVVGGRGEEAAHFRMRAERGTRNHIVALGASVEFVDLARQRRLGPKLGLPGTGLDDPARYGSAASWAFLLAALGMAVSAAGRGPRGDDPAARRVAPAAMALRQSVPLFLAGYLLARAESIGMPVLGATASALGAVVAIAAAWSATRARDGAGILARLLVAHGGVVIAAPGFAAAEVAVALGFGHAAVALAALGPLALAPHEEPPWTHPLGLKAVLPVTATAALTAAAITVAGIGPVGGFFARVTALASLPASSSSFPPRWVAWGLLLTAQFGVALAVGRLVRVWAKGPATTPLARRMAGVVAEQPRVVPALAIIAGAWVVASVVPVASSAALGGSRAGLWRRWLDALPAGTMLGAALVLVAAVVGWGRAGALVRSTLGPTRADASPWARGLLALAAVIGIVETQLGDAAARLGVGVCRQTLRFGTRRTVWLVTSLVLLGWLGWAAGSPS